MGKFLKARDWRRDKNNFNLPITLCFLPAWETILGTFSDILRKFFLLLKSEI